MPRRSHVRCAVARPLRDRRVDLPDHAGGRAGAEDRSRRDHRDRHRTRPESAAARTRWRDQPVRADHGRSARDRHVEASAKRARCGRSSPHRGGSAGARARSSERAVEAARPVVSSGCVDQCAGHARRHGRQQLVRLAIDCLRQHGAQRAGRERLVVGWRSGRVRPGRATRRACGRHRRPCACTGHAAPRWRSPNAGPR